LSQLRCIDSFIAILEMALWGYWGLRDQYVRINYNYLASSLQSSSHLFVLDLSHEFLPFEYLFVLNDQMAVILSKLFFPSFRSRLHELRLDDSDDGSVWGLREYGDFEFGANLCDEVLSVILYLHLLC
jgi:hypothetical protein